MLNKKQLAYIEAYRKALRNMVKETHRLRKTSPAKAAEFINEYNEMVVGEEAREEAEQDENTPTK